MKLQVRDRKTGEKLTAIPQALDLNFDGRYVLRYIIGIENYQGFHFDHACYDNDEFNKRYEVVDEEW